MGKFKSWTLFVTAFVFSFASFSYEIGLARFLSLHSTNQILSQALTIGCFLLGLGAGVYLIGLFKIHNPWRALLFIESGVVGLASLSLPFLQFARILIPLRPQALLFVTVFIAGLLGLSTGIEIPLLLSAKKILNPDTKSSDGFNTILGFSYLGSLGCSLLLPLYFWPSFGLLTGTWLILLVLVLFLGCLHVIFLSLGENKTSLSLFFLMLVALMNAGFVHNQETIEQTYLKFFYYLRPPTLKVKDIKQTLNLLEHFPTIEHMTSRFQEIDLVPVAGVEGGDGFHLFIDQKNQFGSATVKIYHESMVHGSINLRGKTPENILIIGGGDGLVAKELLKYPSIKSITLIELDEKMVELANTHPKFLELNEGALKSPRVHVLVDDGYKFIRNNTEKFDALFVDLPYPYHVDLSRLYSFEFYSFCQRSLAQNGFLVFDFPFYFLLSENVTSPNRQTAAKLLESLRRAGFNNLTSFGSFESFLYASMDQKDVQFNYEALEPYISNASVMNLVLNTIDFSDYRTSEVNSVFRPVVLENPSPSFK